MRNYQEMINRKITEYGNKFSDKDLNKNFIPYYENQKRIEVSFCSDTGKEYERKRGIVGITTGWKPIFLLMLTKRSIGSSWTIGKNDKIVKVV